MELAGSATRLRYGYVVAGIEGKAATGADEQAGTRASFNGAEGISDIEGKAATGSGEQAGKRASFKLVSGIEAPVHCLSLASEQSFDFFHIRMSNARLLKLFEVI